MKKVFSLIAAVTLLTTTMLSGCKGAASTSQPTKQDENTNPSGKLSYLSWLDEKTMEPILTAFTKKYPDVEWDFQNVPSENNQYAQKLQLLANSGELPDLFNVQPPVTTMAKNGYLADLSNLEVSKGLNGAFRSTYTVDKKLYAFCNDCWVGGVYYNKDLFSKYNCSVPKTFDDFLNLCKVFKENKITPINFASDEMLDMVFWMYINDVLFKDPDYDSKLNDGTGSFKEGFESVLNDWDKDFIKTGYVTQDATGTSDDQRMKDFSIGKSAMTISGPWAIATFQKDNPDLKFGIFPFVGNTADYSVTVGAVNVGLSMSSKAKNKSAAEAYINYLGSDEGLAIYQKITGNFLGTDSVKYDTDPILGPVKDYASSGKFSYSSVNWINQSSLTTTFFKGLQNMVLGTTTASQLVDDLDNQNKDLLKANH